MSVPRNISQIAVGPSGDPLSGEIASVLYALAGDGSAWCYRDGGWLEFPPLPDAEGCTTKYQGDPDPCRFAAGHRDQHWNGHRRWA